jgi:ABC-type multidrug transport system fused ATPase/permease subunit
LFQCNVYPASGYDFSISCLKAPNPDGSFVCYYAQGGGAGSNPMSMTCSVGNCLYNLTNATGGSGKITYADTDRYVPAGLAWQEACLLGATCGVLGVALALEGLRRQRERRRHLDFKLRQVRAARAAAAVAVADAAGAAANAARSQRNPLVPPLGSSRSSPVSSGSCSLSSSNASSLEDVAASRPAAATGSAAARRLEPRPRVGSRESSDSGYAPAGARFGASLSWQGVHLWVPARAADQLVAMHAAAAARYAALQRDLGGGVVASSRNPGSPLSSGGGGGSPMDEEQGRVQAREGRVAPELSSGGEPGNSSSSSSVFEKQILTNVGGTARRGGLTALMGPSGAGKTSLLDCLV